MIYQDDLREAEIVAVWAGDAENESDLNEYLGQPFESDYGFLLDQDDLPEFVVTFSEPRLHAHYNRPFLQADVRELLSGFSWSDEWRDEAERCCRRIGCDTAKTVVVFPNLRYRENLARNTQSRLRFIGNFDWPGGRDLWKARLDACLDCPPFHTLTREVFNDDGLFTWKTRVHLESWKGFAPREALAGEFMSFRFSPRPDGDFNVSVDPIDTKFSLTPTAAQAIAFGHLLDNQSPIRDQILQAIFEAYLGWRECYFGGKYSSDGGKTYQSGWEMPDMFPPENMPEIKQPRDLMRIIRPGTVHVTSKEIGGFAKIGIEFSCKWDEEHGLGVMTHKGKVVGVGQADESF